MSVDVEDYFQVSRVRRTSCRAREWDALESRVVANTERLLEHVRRARRARRRSSCSAGSRERFPALVREIRERGHEIASHGYHHQLVYDADARAVQGRRPARRSARSKTLRGVPVRGYRAPSYLDHATISLWALDVLIEEGYGYDTSIFPIRHDRYGIPDAAAARRTCFDGRRAPSCEMPGSTVSIAGVNLPIAGGGYFRLLPYEWTRWGIQPGEHSRRAAGRCSTCIPGKSIPSSRGFRCRPRRA